MSSNTFILSLCFNNADRQIDPAGGSVAKRMNTDVSEQLSRSCDGFIHMCRVCAQIVLGAGCRVWSQRTVTHRRTFLLFTWMFVFSFELLEYLENVSMLNHYKAIQTFIAANWWCPSCIKLVKDEKQVRANFICMDESNFRSLCDLLRPQCSQP